MCIRDRSDVVGYMVIGINIDGKECYCREIFKKVRNVVIDML